MKFWYKKRQTIFFEEKLISDLSVDEPLRKSLKEFFKRDWWLCNSVSYLTGPCQPTALPCYHFSYFEVLSYQSLSANHTYTGNCSGHDTTAAGVSWAIYLIGKHEEVQRKIHAEIDKVILNYTTQYLEEAIKMKTFWRTIFSGRRGDQYDE